MLLVKDKLHLNKTDFTEQYEHLNWRNSTSTAPHLQRESGTKPESMLVSEQRECRCTDHSPKVWTVPHGLGTQPRRPASSRAPNSAISPSSAALWCPSNVAPCCEPLCARTRDLAWREPLRPFTHPAVSSRQLLAAGLRMEKGTHTQTAAPALPHDPPRSSGRSPQGTGACKQPCGSKIQ